MKLVAENIGCCKISILLGILGNDEFRKEIKKISFFKAKTALFYNMKRMK